MPTLRIDFVSDIMCPWCVIGLAGLQRAIASIGDEAEVSIYPQPFELNPDMPREGENVREHISRKYGSGPDVASATRDMIRNRAAEVGFTMTSRPDSRIWNSFDAHRLIAWAGRESATPDTAVALKMALFSAHFTDGADMGDHAVLADVAARTGQDGGAARAMLAGTDLADDVRGRELYWRREGINAVPAAIVNGRYVISGGQPPDKYEKALRAILADS